jgi:hypothetical protein
MSPADAMGLVEKLRRTFEEEWRMAYAGASTSEERGRLMAIGERILTAFGETLDLLMRESQGREARAMSRAPTKEDVREWVRTVDQSKDEMLRRLALMNLAAAAMIGVDLRRVYLRRKSEAPKP